MIFCTSLFLTCTSLQQAVVLMATVHFFMSLWSMLPAGAIQEARELCERTPGGFCLAQFDNPGTVSPVPALHKCSAVSLCIKMMCLEQNGCLCNYMSLNLVRR